MSTHSTDTEIENDTFSKDVLLTVGVYSNIEDAESQDAVLHRVFASICEEAIAGELGAKPIVEAVITLYRLFHAEGWEPARVFFYMLTGQLINKNDKPKCDVNEAYTDTLYSHLTEPVSVPILDPRTVSGECDKHCDLLNALWFDSDSYYDHDDSEDDETNSEDSEGDESEGEEMPDDESVASVGTEDGIVDPREAAVPQWKKK